jgi:hypothetical protein
VYEFWQAGNNYGLVDLLRPNSETWLLASQQKHNNESRVFERRQTNRGTLLIYKDFVNYKTKLAEVGDMQGAAGMKAAESEREGDTELEAVVEAGEGEGEQGEVITKVNRLQKAEWHVPESCVDWKEIVGDLRT